MALSPFRKSISRIDLYPPRRVTLGEVDYAPGGALGPRTQRDVQLVMIDRGSLSLVRDGQKVAVAAGQVVCEWPGIDELYSFDPKRLTTHRWVALRFDDAEPTRRWLARLRTDAPVVRDESAVMRTLFDTAFTMAGDDPAVQAAQTHLALAYFAAFLAPPPEATDADARLPPPLATMRLTIAEAFDQPLTLTDLAGAASVSANHLSRLCRRHLDTTPMTLLREARVHHGLDLLKSTGLRVNEIAYRVGFSNPFHFSRAVRETTGLPPTRVRQRAWEGAGTDGTA